MLEAQNLRALNTTQTPLLGEENTPLHTSAGTGFDGITPRHAVVQTPNLLITPLRGAGGKVGATPRRIGPGATPMRTPFRDDLSINDQDGASVMGETPREQRMRQTQLKQQLKQGFMNLPAPRNEYDILIPDVDKEKDEAVEGVAMDEDMSDVAKRSKQIREAEEKARFLRRSQAVQRDLPRPLSVNAKALVSPPNHDQSDDPLAEAERLVNAELVRLLRHDSIKYPVHGSDVAPGTAAAGLENLEDEFDEELMATARKLVTSEFALFVGVDLEEVENGSWKMPEEDREKFDEVWRRENEDVVFAPSLGKFVKLEEVDAAERIKGLEKMLESNRKSMIRDAARADKIEKKLNITLGGYQARSQTLRKQVVNAFEELEQSEIELESFRNLQIAEKDAIPRRIEALQREVDQLTTRERELQYRYKSIDDEKRKIMDDLIVRLEKQKGSEVDVNVGDTAEGVKMDGVE